MTDNTNPHKNPVMYGPAFECKKKVSGNGALEFANMYPALKGPDGLCALARFLCIPAASTEPMTIADLP
jgi:hypothetical protein